MKYSLFAVILCLSFAALAQDPPNTTTEASELLQKTEPGLYALYQRYPQYHSVFQRYSQAQNMARPVEQISTIVHELIHIDSRIHAGFYVEGVYYEPYLRSDAWPTVTNSELAEQLHSEEKNSRVFWDYVLKTPNNHLGNALDELNAHTHVLPWVCHHEPDYKDTHLKNLNGFLGLVNSYIRVLQNYAPHQYQDLLSKPESRGAMAMLVERGLTARSLCSSTDDPALPYITQFIHHSSVQDDLHE